MRSTVIKFISLLVSCKLACAVGQVSADGSTKCAPHDTECDSLAPERAHYAAMLPKQEEYLNVPWLDIESGLMRYDPGLSMYTNDVHCWPSVGGFIIAQRVHAIEIEYIGLDRFHITPRSTNATDEDAFCMKLRKIGGKWWSGYEDFDAATGAQLRPMWPDEREVLFLGWPEDGGVWVLRYDDKKQVRGHLGPIWNALSMAERCMVLEKQGAVFFERPVENGWR